MSKLVAGFELRGEERVARNFLDTSFHNENIAKAQGLRGALVAAFDNVWPANSLLEEQLSERWLERGRLQVWFRKPVYDGDRIRAVVSGAAADDEFEARYEVLNQLDETVVEGGAGWSPASEPDPAPVPGASDDVSNLRGLAAFQLGAKREVELVLDADAIAENCKLNKDAYQDEERVPTCYLTMLICAPIRTWLNEYGFGAGLFGKIDIRVHRRLRRGAMYQHTATVVGLRRRGQLEFIDTEMRVYETGGAVAGQLACAVSETHVLPELRPH